MTIEEPKPKEEAAPVEPVKPLEEVKPPEEPKPEPVTVEPQKEVNPLEARLDALQKRLDDRDEKERLAAEAAKEVKHEQIAEKRQEIPSEEKPSAGGQDGGGNKSDPGGGPGNKPPQPATRKHHFRLKSRKRTGSQ